jgi:phage terminase small subunit
MTDSSAPPDETTLTLKQQAFIDAYFACGMNASAAARKCGYKNRANTAAAQLMSNDVIRREIERLYRESTMPAVEVLARLSEHARADIADVTDAEGKLSMRKAQKNGKTGVIKSITHTTTIIKGVETRTLKVELHDSQKAIQLLGKYHRLFVERVQVEDWRSQAIQDIKDGVLDYATVKSLFDETLAQELFRAAGVPVMIADDD